MLSILKSPWMILASRVLPPVLIAFIPLLPSVPGRFLPYHDRRKSMCGMGPTASFVFGFTTAAWAADSFESDLR